MSSMMIKTLRLVAYSICILFVTYKIAETRSYLFFAIAPATFFASLVAQTALKTRQPKIVKHLISLKYASLICLIITIAIFWFASTYLVT